jgi:hypothetical protein
VDLGAQRVTAGETARKDETMKAQIARMQTKRSPRPEIWQNPNGTWSHHKDGQREFDELSTCEIDLRWHKEWEAVA